MMNWTEPYRTELNWTELNWTELNRTEQNWTELNWTELNWTELNWTELNWICVFCDKSSWVELSWVGVERNRVYQIANLNWRRTEYVGPNLVFCCSSAPRTPLTAGVTDRQMDRQTDRQTVIIKVLWALWY